MCRFRDYRTNFTTKAQQAFINQAKDLIMITDSPISKLSEDDFGRKTYIKGLSNLIGSSLKDKTKSKALSKGSLTIGVYGEWGSGKTSVINALRNDLKSEHKLKTGTLNPWLYRSEEEIILRLLKTVYELSVSSFDKEGKAAVLGLFNKFGNLALAAGSLYLKVSTMGQVNIDSREQQHISKIVSDVFTSKDDDILEVKDKINRYFLKAKTPIIIFIDDVDRLSNQELKILFRTIRALLDFNNVCYVLAFDPIAVAKSISADYGEGSIDSGMEYIEKIINVPTYIPSIDATTLRKHTIEKALEIEPSDINNYFFEKYIGTPRQAKRLINQFIVTRAFIDSEEINDPELFSLEILRISAGWEFKLIKEFWTLMQLKPINSHLFNKVEKMIYTHFTTEYKTETNSVQGIKSINSRSKEEVDIFGHFSGLNLLDGQGIVTLLHMEASFAHIQMKMNKLEVYFNLPQIVEIGDSE